MKVIRARFVGRTLVALFDAGSAMAVTPDHRVHGYDTTEQAEHLAQVWKEEHPDEPQGDTPWRDTPMALGIAEAVIKDASNRNPHQREI